MKRCVWGSTLAILVASLFFVRPGRAAEEVGVSTLGNLPIERYTLDNGLRVVLSEDHTVPTVAIAVYYDVGSRDEEKGRSGFAHLFEHMMFQGSANVGKGEHFSLVINRGGSANGTTSNDRTNYFETLPSHELALGLWLEADRMRSLAITQDNFENQRQTVMEERRQRIDNQPYVPSMLRINELAYGDYWPYSHSTIGDMEDLMNAPLSAVQQFFDNYYAPNNAVLTIVGDFEPSEARLLVQKYFEEVGPGKITRATFPPIVPQAEERTETMYDANATLPAFHVAYHIPPNRTVDHYALEMLSLILGDGKSSRLYQKLVKNKEICQEIVVGTDDRRGPDLFSFWGVMASGHEPQDAEVVVFSELQSVAKRGVSQRELDKAKNRVRSAFVLGLQSNMSRAMQLSQFELYYGDANLLKSELNPYLQVSRADIQRVANTYFSRENRTVLNVVPAEAPKAETQLESEESKP